MTEASLALMKTLRAQLAGCDWTTEAIGALVKAFCKEQGVKMGQVGMPVRALVCGTTQTPSVDATLALIGKDETLRRMDQYLI